jgi:hypothetical protein
VSITALFGLYGYTSPTPAPGSTYGQYFSITCITDRCVPYRRHRYHPVRTWHRDCGTRRGRRGLLTAPTSPWGNKSMPRPPRHTWSLAAPLCTEHWAAAYLPDNTHAPDVSVGRSRALPRGCPAGLSPRRLRISLLEEVLLRLMGCSGRARFNRSCEVVCRTSQPRPARCSDSCIPLFSPAACSLRSISQTRFRTQQASFLTSQSQVRPRVDRCMRVDSCGG